MLNMLKRIHETLKQNDLCITFAILLFWVYFELLLHYYGYMTEVLSLIGAGAFGAIVAKVCYGLQNFIKKELDL